MSNHFYDFKELCSKIFSSIGFLTSGVARAFPGGRLAHPEGQNEEENK